MAATLTFALIIGVPEIAAQLTDPQQGSSPQQNRSTGIDTCVVNPNAPQCQTPIQPNGPGMGETLGKAVDRAQPGDVDNSAEYPSTSNSVPAQVRPIRTPVYEPPTEFQNLVADSVGTLLPIYGRKFFDQAPTTFAPMNQLPVPSDYLIGPGDELVVRVWGQINFQARVVVSRDGQIYIPKVGAIVVAGTHFSDIEQHLRTEITRVYKSFELSVSMGRLRTIDVFVVGQARYPGKYSLSSLSTVMNAVFESGGPTLQGSMRRIRLNRDRKVIAEFDLYDVLGNGSRSNDAQLQSGDVIEITTVGPQMALAGSVTLPAVYELKDNDTLADILKIAGGLSVVADAKSAIIERINEHSVRLVEQFTLNQSGLSSKLRGGDIVRIMSVSPRFENAVTIRGNVANPGRYPWREGMRISDLIPNRDFLLTRNYWVQQNLLVEGCATEYPISENIPKKPNQNPSKEADARSKPCAPRVDDQALRDNVKVTSPEINWEYAVIQRLDPTDLSSVLLPFNLGNALANKASENDLVLNPGDVLTIFSQKDIAVPEEAKAKFVKVEGEVKAPGIYRVTNTDTIEMVIQRAGGITAAAYLYGTQLERESAKRQQRQLLDDSVSMLERQLDQGVVTTSNTPDAAATTSVQAQAGRQLLQRLRDTPVTGRIVLQMKPDDKDISSIPKMTLEDGDRIFIPHFQKTVTVIGSVFRQSSYLYAPGRRVSDYVRISGNMQNADRGHILLVRADGSVVTRGSHSRWSGGVESNTVLPGDTIVIPSKQFSGNWIRAIRDWGQIASQFAITAASLAVINR